MTPERYARAKEVLLTAASLPDAARPAYVREACGEDGELLGEVESLLAQHGTGTGPIGTGALTTLAASLFAAGADSRARARMPERIGPYRIVGILGEGGMGVVYRAEQQTPVRREVAIKLARGGQESAVVLARFEAERQALARMEHPNIARLLDAGSTAEGRPYFVMELVRGVPITEYCRSEAVDLRGRLRLCLEVCRAVRHAHRRGVLHRDLKPSNVLVTIEHGGPVPKVIDFSIAKAFEDPLLGTEFRTRTGQIVGTLEYMSPEQARGELGAVDLRTDVYALGVVLYELLADRLPCEVSGLPLHEAVARIVSNPPRALRAPAGSATGRLDADLETIVSKCLEKDPDRRYGGAAELAEDLERFLDSRPILARPPSATYQLRKFAARNRVLVGGLAATTFVVLTGGFVSTAFGLREARQRRVADSARAEAEQIGYVAGMSAAEAGLRLFEIAEVKRRLAACPPPLRGWEWHHLSFRSEMSERVLTGHTSRVHPVAVSPDGTLFASGSADPENSIRIWDAATGEPRLVLEGGVPTATRTGGVRSLAFSPDGTRLASASDDGTVRIWEVSSGRKLLELRGHEERVSAVAFTPDGREVVSGSFDHTVRRWDALTGASLGAPYQHQGQVWAVTVCSEGDRIVSGGEDETARVWDRRTGRALLAIQAEDDIMGLACSPTGDRIAAAGGNGAVWLWDAVSGRVDWVARHEDVVRGVAYSPDGRMLATSSKDRTIRIWDASSGAPLATLVGHDDLVPSIAYDPTGSTLISGSGDRTIRVWKADPNRTSPVLAIQPGGIAGIEISPDGSRVLSGTATDGIRIWDAGSGREVSRIPMAGSQLLGFEVSPDGTLVVSYHRDKKRRIWQIPPVGLPFLQREEAMDGFRAAAFIPGTSTMLVGYSAGGVIRRWDVRSGVLSDALRTTLEKVDFLAFSPDGSRLALSGGPADWKALRRLQLMEVATGRLLAEHEIRHADPGASTPCNLGALRFHPDGTRLVTTHLQDHTVRLWDGHTLELLATRTGHAGEVWSAAFSPDGSRLATAGQDYTVRLWDGVTGEPLLALRTGRLSPILRVVFTPDGSAIVSGEITYGAQESTIRIWRTRS